jgi:hypothetical protein
MLPDAPAALGAVYCARENCRICLRGLRLKVYTILYVGISAAGCGTKPQNLTSLVNMRESPCKQSTLAGVFQLRIKGLQVQVLPGASIQRFLILIGPATRHTGADVCGTH